MGTAKIPEDIAKQAEDRARQATSAMDPDLKALMNAPLNKPVKVLCEIAHGPSQGEIRRLTAILSQPKTPAEKELVACRRQISKLQIQVQQLKSERGNLQKEIRILTKALREKRPPIEIQTVRKVVLKMDR